MRPFLTLHALILCLAAPALGADLACPPGWSPPSEGCDAAKCIAPMETGRIQIDSFASVAGQTMAGAFDSLEKIVAAEGTPLRELVAHSEPEIAGLGVLRRDYAGAARGVDLRITLVLARDGGQDILLRAIWDAGQGLLFEHLIDQTIAGWNPRLP